MDLINHIPGVSKSVAFRPGPNTPAPWNVLHIGAVDGNSPFTATKNMAEIYNRFWLEFAAAIEASGLAIDHDNWTQLAEAIKKTAMTSIAEHEISVSSPITGTGQVGKPLGIDCGELKEHCGIPGVDDILEGDGISVEVEGTHSVRIVNTAPFRGVATDGVVSGNGTPGNPLGIDCGNLINHCGLLTPGRIIPGNGISVNDNGNGTVTVTNTAPGGGGGGPVVSGSGGWHAVAMDAGFVNEAGAGNLMVIGPPGAQFDDPDGTAGNPGLNAYTVGGNGLKGITVQNAANSTVRLLRSNGVAVAWFTVPT
ncbi:hypothetical protein ABIC89_000258 [Variovorax boronicumulans]|uniref:hypothetical protein n=1 Tax=Variovorax boronicumulans TaxID=436515 RepID=UPI00339B75E1